MSGYSLSDLQRIREEMEMFFRLHQVEREHRFRQIVGDDVADFIQATRIENHPMRRAMDQLREAQGLVDRITEEER